MDDDDLLNNDNTDPTTGNTEGDDTEPTVTDPTIGDDEGGDDTEPTVEIPLDAQISSRLGITYEYEGKDGRVGTTPQMVTVSPEKMYQ